MNINAQALSQPIQPNIGLGGFTLNMHEEDLININKNNYGIDNSFYGEKKYIFLSGAIVVAVDNETKKIFRISAMKGYYGKLFNKIFVGMPIKDLLNDTDYCWKFIEEHGGFECDQLPGINIATDIEDPTEAEVLTNDRYIGEISIYDQNFCI